MTAAGRAPGQSEPAAGSASVGTLPPSIIKTLDLPPAELLKFKGFGSEEMRLHVYVVEIILPERPPVSIQAIGGEGEPYILLGRDVLNHFKIILDGPGLALEIQ